MRDRQALDCSLLVSAVAVSRFLFRSHYLYDLDSVDFAMALDRFDPSVYQPHPPGYFLYVCLGRLARMLFPEANTALVAVSIAASCAAVAMIYVLGDEWFGRRAAFFAGLLFLFSPLCWFHGTVAVTYIVECFFAALIGYLCWRSYSGETAYLIPSAVALGVCAGIRQTSIVWLGPLWLFSLHKAGRRKIAVALASLLVTLLAWFIPMVSLVGGLAAYFSPLRNLWGLALAKHTASGSWLVMSFARFCTIIGIFGLIYGAASLVPFFISGAGSEDLRAKRTFTLIWMMPALLFFTFVYLMFVVSGYLLVLAPVSLAWMGHWAATLFDRPYAVAWRKWAVAGALGAINVALFLYAPVYCSYGSVRHFEAELDGVIRSLRQVASPQDTMIVGLDAHFLGYRHAGYYLPEYLTVQYPEVSFPSGTRVFVVRHRSTSVVSELPAKGMRRFILFPLPEGKEYSQYLSALESRFPAGALTPAARAGRDFLTGAVSDLHILFPITGASPAEPYTPEHTHD